MLWLKLCPHRLIRLCFHNSLLDSRPLLTPRHHRLYPHHHTELNHPADCLLVLQLLCKKVLSFLVDDIVECESQVTHLFLII